MNKIWKKRMPKLIEKYELMVGDSYGNWIIIGVYRDDNRKQHRWRFQVRCDCNFETEMSVYTFLSGRTTKCQKCSYAVRKPFRLVDKKLTK